MVTIVDGVKVRVIKHPKTKKPSLQAEIPNSKDGVWLQNWRDKNKETLDSLRNEANRVKSDSVRKTKKARI